MPPKGGEAGARVEAAGAAPSPALLLHVRGQNIAPCSLRIVDVSATQPHAEEGWRLQPSPFAELLAGVELPAGGRCATGKAGCAAGSGSPCGVCV